MLYPYGFRGKAHKLIDSYLSSRQQYVSFGDINYSLQNIELGVPQGSTLGAILFLLYISDRCNATNSLHRLLADDTCLIPRNPSFAQLQKKRKPNFSQSFQMGQN